MKALERQSLQAERATVRRLLDSLPEADILGRMSFESRAAEIDAELAKLDAYQDSRGSVALIFHGEPVHGSRSIDATFASDALKSFQDLVSKRVAVEEIGVLAQRGPLPLKVRTNLGLTQLVRGSLGFILEEESANEVLADTAVKQAIDDVSSIIEKTASEDFNAFEEAVGTMDHRLLLSLRVFFKNLDENRAQLRIVEGDRDASLDAVSVRRARNRVESTEINEHEPEPVIGELLGLLPEAKRFEMRLETGEMIRGTVMARTAEEYVQLIEQPGETPVGRHWRVLLQIREVRELNRPMRRLYTLMGLLRPVE